MISLVLRAGVTMLFLTAAGGLVAGCGSSGGVSAGDGTYGGSAQITKAQVVAYAHAVNLRATDVPVLVGAKYPRRHETRSGPFGTAWERCAGEDARSREVIGITSQSFERNNARQHGQRFGDSLLPTESVQSAVYFMRSPALASREIAVAVSAHGRACFKHLDVSQNATVVPEGTKVGEPLLSQIEVSALRLPLRGTQVSGLRTTAEVAIEVPGTTGRSNSYEDALAFTMGPAVITLQATGDPHPFPPAIERRLLALLYSRAKTHKFGSSDDLCDCPPPLKSGPFGPSREAKGASRSSMSASRMLCPSGRCAPRRAR